MKRLPNLFSLAKKFAEYKLFIGWAVICFNYLGSSHTRELVLRAHCRYFSCHKPLTLVGNLIVLSGSVCPRKTSRIMGRKARFSKASYLRGMRSRTLFSPPELRRIHCRNKTGQPVQVQIQVQNCVGRRGCTSNLQVLHRAVLYCCNNVWCGDFCVA
jgi:hypothetical protein